MRSPAGVGTIHRAVTVLKALARAGGPGLGVTQVAHHTGLAHATAHRLLAQLMAEGFVHQGADARYRLGPVMFELGVAAGRSFDIRGVARPALQRLSTSLGDTAYLFLRSGSESVCLDRYTAHAPIRVVPLEVGSSRPLGVGASGLAILAALSPEERDSTLREVEGELASDWNLTPDLVQDAVNETEIQGFAYIEEQLTPGVNAVGLAICDSLGQPFAALAVAAMAARLPASRAASVAAAARIAVTAIEGAVFPR